MPDADTSLSVAGMRTDDGTVIACQGAFGVAFGLGAATAVAGTEAASAAAVAIEMTALRSCK